MHRDLATTVSIPIAVEVPRSSWRRPSATTLQRRSILPPAAWVLCALLLLLGSGAQVHAQQACYQWDVTDNGFDSGWRADNQSVVAAWVAAKNNGAQITGCGSTSHLYGIQSVTPTNVFPTYNPYNVVAAISPGGNALTIGCPLTFLRTCPPLYFAAVSLPPLTDCGPPCNGVGDPISPATGNVNYSETDVPASGAGNPLSFTRTYNSTDSNSGDLGVAWRHSYSRSIAPIFLSTPYQPYVPGDPNNSSLYSDVASACVSGLAEIKAGVSTWQNATASYANGVCTLTSGGVAIGTLRIRFADPYPPPPESTIVGYQATRDDGQRVQFTLAGTSIVAPPGITLRLQQTGSGYTLTDSDDSV